MAAEETITETQEAPTIEAPQAQATPQMNTIFDEGRIKRLSMISRGIDPDAQQTMNKFIDLSNKIERSNFPNTDTVLCLSQLKGFSRLYYPNNPDNPFEMLSEELSSSFMARLGWKSQQFVDMTKQTMSISDLQTLGADTQRSLLDKALGRGKPE